MHFFICYNKLGDSMNIKASILNSMPNNLNKLEQARYIYLKLGLLFNFSTKFNNTTSGEYANMYTKKYDTDKLKNNQLICKLWAKLYSELLMEIGIENSVVNFGHEYVSFRIDGVMWIADATNGNYSDLSKIKYGDDTSCFGISYVQKTRLEEGGTARNTPEDIKQIDEIDKKFDDYYKIKLAHRKLVSDLNNLKDMNFTIKEKMEYLFSKVGRLKDGYYETKEYLKSLEYEMLSLDDFTHITGTELKRTNKNKEVDIVQCITVNENGVYNYYLVAPNQPVTRVEPNDLIRLSILGYSIDDKSIPGIDFPKKFIPGKVSSKPLKYKLFKDSIPKVILPYDEEQISILK